MKPFSKSFYFISVKSIAICGILFVVPGAGCADLALTSEVVISTASLQKDVSVELITESSKDFRLPDKSRIENQKLPLSFKLTYGGENQLCQSYVSMLNAAKYMGYPACERIILSNYLDVKYPEWEEITDKENAIHIMEERLTLAFAAKKKLASRDYVIKANLVKRNIDTGDDKLYRFNADLNGDGKVEVIYKHTWIFRGAESFAHCKTGKEYYVDDSTVSLENPKMYKTLGYDFLSGSGYSNLMIIQGSIYREAWEGPTFENVITIYTLDKLKVCNFSL